jgi:hypothetical protein
VDGRTPLSYAAAHKHVAVEALLKTKGVDPDSVDKENKSVLRHALECCGGTGSWYLPDKVEALLATQKVDVLRVANDGESAFSYARKHLKEYYTLKPDGYFLSRVVTLLENHVTKKI